MELIIMDHTGDTRLIWDVDNKDEVANAQRTYNDLKKKGFLAYSVGKKGKPKEVIEDFDKNLEMIIMVPPMVGG